jgi:hypothetical protein
MLSRTKQALCQPKTRLTGLISRIKIARPAPTSPMPFTSTVYDHTLLCPLDCVLSLWLWWTAHAEARVCPSPHDNTDLDMPWLPRRLKQTTERFE